MTFRRWFPSSAFSPDGRAVAANTPVGTLVIVDPDTGAPLWEAARAPGLAWIGAAVWLPDSNHLVVGCADNAVNVWRMRPLQWVLGLPAQPA